MQSGTIFDTNLNSTKLSNIMDTHKHENKEKLPINNFSLFAFKLVIYQIC